MLTLLDMFLNSLSIAHDTSRSERSRRVTIALWCLVFVAAFVVANVT